MFDIAEIYGGYINDKRYGYSQSKNNNDLGNYY